MYKSLVKANRVEEPTPLSDVSLVGRVPPLAYTTFIAVPVRLAKVWLTSADP